MCLWKRIGMEQSRVLSGFSTIFFKRISMKNYDFEAEFSSSMSSIIGKMLQTPFPLGWVFKKRVFHGGKTDLDPQKLLFHLSVGL